MQITVEQQDQRDFDWFAVDAAGNIGNFTTAGFKHLPQTVSTSAEDRRYLTDYFLERAPISGEHNVDIALAEVVGPENTPERYLRHFVAMADKGLFSFDIKSYLEPGISYFRVASPTSSIHLDDLPESVRKILERTVVTGRLFKNSFSIPYDETLSW